MEEKISESNRIEAGNLIEESSDIFSSCVQCGLCKGRCGVFRVLREEQFSARGKGKILSRKSMDVILFECNLCKACEESCPLNLKICDAILKAREAMVLLGRGLKNGRKMSKIVLESGNYLMKDTKSIWAKY